MKRLLLGLLMMLSLTTQAQTKCDWAGYEMRKTYQNQNYFEFYISKENPSFKLSNAHYKVDFNKQISNFIINKSYAIYQFDKINDIKILYNDNYLLLNALKDDYLRVRFRDNQLYIYETQPFSEKQYSNPDIIQSMFTDYLYNPYII